jgi:FkbM family methyltransferase
MLRATEQDVHSAHRIFLGRDPDAEELQNCRSRINAGLSVDQLVSDLKNLDEYSRRTRPAFEQVEIRPNLFAVVDPDEPDFGKVIVKYRAWEPHIVAVIRRYLKPGNTYVDIGANVGIMTLNAAQVVGKRGKVVAFEPNAKNASMLLRAVTVNGFKNVVLVPVAASDREGVVALSNDSSNSYLIDGGSRGELVQTVRADMVLAGEAHVDFIKIDIEGFEPAALSGLVETMRRCRPRMLCEFNPRCLRDHAGLDYRAVSQEIFKYTSQIIVIDHAGKEVVVDSGIEIDKLWKAKNNDAVRDGFLPDGMLHFDLLFTADKLSSERNRHISIVDRLPSFFSKRI